MGNFYGIDFGTTNSAVVMIAEDDNGVPMAPVNTGEDKRPLPSFVAINKTNGSVETGLEVKQSITDNDEYIVFSSIKSIIGEDREWKIAGKTWTQIDIAAELFKALKKNAKIKTNTSMTEAVLAVPIGFSSTKKNNLRLAAKKAGIDITMFISEPTAAFCSRAHELKKYKNIAVFDWGGGTLDVVIIQVDGTKIKELATVGMNLAGNDIDKKLAEKICLRLAHKRNMEFTFGEMDSNLQLRLLTACENAKCNLADEDIASITIAKLGDYGRVLEKIDYEYFSLLIEDEINRACECLSKALVNASMNKENIDCILCVGGSSRLKPLQEKLAEIYGREKMIFPRQAMWDIGSGAAFVALRPGCYTLNKPMGIILSNNKFYPLLNVGQRIPTEEKTITMGVIDSNQEARFILTDGEDTFEQSFMEYFPVRLRGFDDEILKVSCYIDSDLIFKLKVASNRMPNEYFRVWTYDNIKISYDIEGDH